MQTHEVDDVMYRFQELARSISDSWGASIAKTPNPWRTVFSEFDIDAANQALNTILSSADKKLAPSQVRDLLMRAQNRKDSPSGFVCKSACPITKQALIQDEIATETKALTKQAWVWYFRKTDLSALANLTVITFGEEALLSELNRQAKKYNIKLKDEFKLAEYWR